VQDSKGTGGPLQQVVLKKLCKEKMEQREREKIEQKVKKCVAMPAVAACMQAVAACSLFLLRCSARV
jgi:hypothetical protein